MKKVSKILLMAAVAVGMVACSNDVPEVDTQGKGDRFISVAFTMTAPSVPSGSAVAGTRAISDDSQAGTAAETSLSDASALVVALNPTTGARVASAVFPINTAYGTTPTPGQYIPNETATLEVPAGSY